MAGSTQPALLARLVSQAGGGEAPGGTQWLLRGGKMGRMRRRAQTSRQVDVELAQVAVLRGVVAQGPGQTGKSAGAAWQGLWARLGAGRRCPSACRHGLKVPARASKARGVRAARVAKIVTGVGPAAGPSVPSATVAIGLLKKRARTGLGQGSGAHLSMTPKVDRLEAAVPAKSKREKVTSSGKRGASVVRQGRCEGRSNARCNSRMEAGAAHLTRR